MRTAVQTGREKKIEGKRSAQLLCGRQKRRAKGGSWANLRIAVLIANVGILRVRKNVKGDGRREELRAREVYELRLRPKITKRPATSAQFGTSTSIKVVLAIIKADSRGL